MRNILSLICLFLFALVVPSQASILFFDGFETGELSPFTTIGTPSVVSTPIHSGNYAAKLLGNNANQVVTGPGGFNASTCYLRGYIYVDVSVNPGSQNDMAWFYFNNGSSARIGGLFLVLNTDGTVQIHSKSDVSSVSGASFSISKDTWYLVELKIVISATVGVIEWKLNGVIQETLSSQNTGTDNVDSISIRMFSGATGTSFSVFDDLMVSNSAYPGPGRCIARQGKAGTPTYDQYTKTSSQTATQVWSETPYSATNNATDSTSGHAQTMLTASFSATQSGHGAEIIPAGSTLNACKVTLIGKTGSASTHSIRVRLNGSNTDTSKSFTTSDGYYETAVFTDTLANLNASEIGVLHGANANSHTIEDVWMMVDYTPLTGVYITASTSGSTSVSTAPTTASISILTNDLVLLTILSSGTTNAATGISGLGLTWVSVSATLWDTAGTPTKRLQIWRGMGTAASGTVTWTVTGADGIAWSLVAFSGCDTSGTNGSGAIVQHNETATVSATSVGASLNPFGDAVNNVAFGAYGINSIGGITPGSGFTEIHDVTYTSPSAELQTEWATGDAGPTASFASSNDGTISVEIKAAATSGASLPIPILVTDEE